MSAPFCSRRTTSSLSLAAHAARNTQSAENLILRAIWRGCAGSRFVSDCSQRFSCSARLNRAELERVSRDIAPAAAAGGEKKHDALAALGCASPSLDGADGAAPATGTTRSYNHLTCRAHRLLLLLAWRTRATAHTCKSTGRRTATTHTVTRSFTRSLACSSVSLSLLLPAILSVSLFFALRRICALRISHFALRVHGDGGDQRRLHYTHARCTYTYALAFTARDSTRETGVSRGSWRICSIYERVNRARGCSPVPKCYRRSCRVSP